MSAVFSSTPMNAGALIHVFESALMDAFDDAFDDAVAATQKNFRAVFQAMARPGAIVTLPRVPNLPIYTAASEVTAGLLALVSTMCDADTALWVDDSLRTPAFAQYLRFHCAAPLVEKQQMQECRFALIADPANMPRLNAFSNSRLEGEIPTLFIACPLGLIKSVSSPLPSWFWEDFATSKVDVVFVDTTAQSGLRIMAMPSV